MDVYHSSMLGCSHFASPDHLVVHCWVHSTLFHPDPINPIEPNIYYYTKLFEAVVGYTPWVFLVPNLWLS